MRCSEAVLFFAFCALGIPLFGQQVQQTTVSPAIATNSDAKQATRDPRAMEIVQKVFEVAGGIDSIRSVHDYTASGSISYDWDQGDQGKTSLQGSVAIIGRGPNQFRLDANLPTGQRSWSMDKKKWTVKNGDGKVSSIPALPPVDSGSVAFPYKFLLVAMNNSALHLSYAGPLQADGRSIHVIRAQRVLPRAAIQAIGSDAGTMTVAEYWIDANTYQIVQTQDFYPRQMLHMLRYSDYRQQNGLLVPFGISELIEDRPTWTVHLDRVMFNSNVQDLDFGLK